MSLSFDPDVAVETLASADPRMRDLIERAGPVDLTPRAMLSPFQSLLRAIVYQQLSGKAAATIYGRVQALFPSDEGTTPEHILDADEQALRGAGLSRAKTKAVKDLAVKTLDGIVPPLDELKQMSDDDIIERLIQVRGIGRWTVEMLLIFRLGRPDVLPVNDLGVRKGLMRVDGLDALPAPVDLRDRGEVWKPYRSVASRYLWRAVHIEYLPG